EAAVELGARKARFRDEDAALLEERPHRVALVRRERRRGVAVDEAQWRLALLRPRRLLVEDLVAQALPEDRLRRLGPVARIQPVDQPLPLPAHLAEEDRRRPLREEQDREAGVAQAVETPAP